MRELGVVGKELDLEWYHLIMEAKNIGINIEDVRTFIMSKEIKNEKEYIMGKVQDDRLAT